MQFYEWHRINCTYSNNVGNYRQEIASPQRLLFCVLDNIYNPWRIYRHDGCVLYYKRFHHYFILTQKPRMFDFSFSTPEDWLENHWDTLAIITTDISNNIATSNNYHQTRVYIAGHHPENILDDLIDEKCYTVFNGLTLFLALHRIGILKCNTIYATLQQFVATNGVQPLQNVPDDWHEIYYDRNIPNIADHPWYYLCMGIPWADRKIMELFRWNDIDPFPEMVTQSMVVFTSAHTAMFPYFNISFWKSHEEWLSFDENIIPDYTGFFMGVTRTKRAFKWYLNNHENVATKFRQVVTPSYCYRLFHTLFNIYNSGYQQARIRRIWKLYILTCCQPRLLNYLLRRHQTMYIPIGFLKDIVPHVNIYETGVLNMFQTGVGTVDLYYRKYIERTIMWRLKGVEMLCPTHEHRVVISQFLKENKSMLWENH